MKQLPLLALVGIIVCLSACTTAPPVSVKTDFDRGAQFGRYHTYALDPGPTGLAPSGDAALQEALRSTLAGRGLTEAARGNADLYIISTVITQEKLHSMPTGVTTYVPSRYGRYGGTWLLNTDVREYTEGALVIDVVDRKSRALVFRGIGQAVVGIQERNAAAIKEAVSKMAAEIPSA